MFLTTSLLFGALLAANGCPLDFINCTIPYDDFNISTIDATQYCHVDNCTIKITKTGDELNIAYHNDQYHLGCTTTTLQLLEVNDKLCRQRNETKTRTLLQILNSVLRIVAFTIHISILIAVVKQKMCSSLPFCLLLAATVVWIIFCAVTTIHSFMKYILKVPNAVCITTLFLAISLGHCAIVIEFQLFLAMLYTFYRCYKLSPLLSEETKKKFFWRSVTAAICVVVVINSSRVVVVFQEANYLTYDGYCIAAIGTVSEVTPFMLCINIILPIFVLIAEIVVLICIGLLLLVLIRNKSYTESTNSHKYMKDMIRILIILVSSSVLSMIVSYVVAAAFIPDYHFTIGTSVMICERCVILFSLLKCG
ncbi:uncharacterized protein [Dysidea avara]|uniref:uncharacterized protein n=1 Tax=Dysidea avara TaxID=196820 RepID=UPI0033224AD1